MKIRDKNQAETTNPIRRPDGSSSAANNGRNADGKLILVIVVKFERSSKYILG
jgi:hypothetical protein